MKEIVMDINAIFEIARCVPPPVAWEERVASLLDAAFRLSSALQQKAYAKAYFTTSPVPGDGFRPEKMQDVLKNPQHRLESPVSCTLALGLAYSVHPKDGPAQLIQILPSEVVQEQSLDDLLDD